jgi:hypothetical protein
MSVFGAAAAHEMFEYILLKVDYWTSFSLVHVNNF